MKEEPNLKALLLSLNEVQYTITPTQFRHLFGDTASHLWGKYTGVFNYNLLSFFTYLDDEKKVTMCDYLLNYHQYGYRE